MRDQAEEKIRALIEQRVIEATKKQMTQKLLLIAKFLGRPIIAQSILGNKLDDPWRLEEDIIYDPTNLPLQDPDEWSTTERGFHFDGLSCGINLCITALFYDRKVEELKVTYNGYMVFAESEGVLRAYAPFPAWENAVTMFHEAAVQKEKKKLIEEKQHKQEDNRRKRESFWQKFRMLWGY